MSLAGLRKVVLALFFCEILGSFSMFDTFFGRLAYSALQGAAAEYRGHLAHRTPAAAATATPGLSSSGDFQGLETW